MKKRVLSFIVLFFLIISTVGQDFLALAQGDSVARSFALLQADPDGETTGEEAGDGKSESVEEDGIKDGESGDVAGNNEGEAGNVANGNDDESGDKTENGGKVESGKPEDGKSGNKKTEDDKIEDDKSGDKKADPEDKTDDTNVETGDKTDDKNVESGDKTDETGEKHAEEKESEKNVITFDGKSYTVVVSYGADAGIPMEGVELQVSEILPDDKGYDFFVSESAKKLGTDEKNLGIKRVFTIIIVDAKDPTLSYELNGKVNVSIRLTDENPDNDNVDVVRFEEKKTKKSRSAETFSADAFIIDEVDSEVNGESVEFTTDSLAVYVITETLQKIIEAGDGKTYRITVKYNTASGIPAGAELVVSEVSDKEYEEYLAEAAKTLGADVHNISYGKLFNISIVKDGVEYQPDNAVTVTIELLDAENVSDVRVVHFDDNDTAEKLTANTDGSTVTFETDGFSVFSFLDFSLIDRVVDATLGEKKGVLYENDDIILTGKMPASGIVEATRVDVTVDGQDALVAYDIKIYANAFMKTLGINWQPGEGAIQVTVKSKTLDSKLVNVYHMDTVSSEPELVAEEVAVEDNSVTFDAESFSVYAFSARLTLAFIYCCGIIKCAEV